MGGCLEQPSEGEAWAFGQRIDGVWAGVGEGNTEHACCGLGFSSRLRKERDDDQIRTPGRLRLCSLHGFARLAHSDRLGNRACSLCSREVKRIHKYK